MCITCISNAQNEGWHLLPFVPSQTLWDIHCVNKDTAVAVGENGYIVRTTNGGSHWDSVYSTTTNTLYKITFLNDTVGYVCGTNGTVLKTTNSGLTWANIGISTSLNFLSMSFINQDTGWIVGGNGTSFFSLYGDKGIYIKTNNGGKKWEIDTNYNSLLTSVFFLDNDTGYLAISNEKLYLLKTKDGGKTYDTIQQSNKKLSYQAILNIFFIDAKTGFFINGADIYKTNNYGLYWDKTVTPSYLIHNAYFLDSCNLYYDWWDNTMGSSTSNACIGINHCEDSIFDEFDLSDCAYDFLTMEYGYCSGYGKQFENYRNFIYKLGVYDAIKEIESEKNIKVFPNPCTDRSTLTFSTSFNVKTLNIVIYNTLGQRINTDIKVNDQEIQIDLSTEKSGVYFVSIQDKNKIIQNCKLIKL